MELNLGTESMETGTEPRNLKLKLWNQEPWN